VIEDTAPVVVVGAARKEDIVRDVRRSLVGARRDEEWVIADSAGV
jgi:hypothetical protein